MNRPRRIMATDEELILAEENMLRLLSDQIINHFSPNMEPMTDDVKVCLKIVMGLTAGMHTE